MGEARSTIAELEDAIQHGSQEKRVETLRRVTDLFLSDAGRLNESQIAVFDDVLCRLVKRIEIKALAELSTRLAPIDNAPTDLVHRLARNNEIAIAGPVLSQSRRLTNDDLIEIANQRGQQHLLAIAGRRELEDVVTDVLVSRGDREVKHRLAGNTGARFSETGFRSLLQSADNDESMIERIGLRIDLPAALLRDLLSKATEAARARLLAAAPSDRREAIQRTLSKISSEVGREVAAPRDFSQATQTINSMRARGVLNEEALLAFANERRYEEMVAALGALCSTSVELIAALTKSARSDGLLVACKAAGLQWATTKAILDGRTSRQAMTAAEWSRIEDDYRKLSRPSAERTLRFWKVRVAAA